MSRSHSLVLGDGGSIEVFCGVEVARETHHAVALDRAGRRLVDRPLPNDETALRNLFTELAERGRLLVVVDQPASIGALAIAVARSVGGVAFGGAREGSVRAGVPVTGRERTRRRPP